MKKLLLLTAVSALSASAFAEGAAEPKVLENSIAYSMSANAQYIMSFGFSGIKIFDMVSGQTFDYCEGSESGIYTPGLSRCVSDNGIAIGYEGDEEVQYWKDGEWIPLPLPEYATSTNLANSITPDGHRICGSIGVAETSFSEDKMMQAPCIWNWNDASGEFGDPVMLPHPDKDFTGRTPQYVTAVDISDDGKTIVGQVMTATGMVLYPIIYSENEKGEWSYNVPDDKYLYPEGANVPEYPGEFNYPYPTEESFMTSAEIDAYQKAYQAWIDSDYTLPYPDHKEFMTEEEIAAYEKAMAEYNVVYGAWSEKFDAYMDYFYSIAATIPEYQFNSIRISPDGKKYANTITVASDDPFAWPGQGSNYIWVFDIESGAITKYEQEDDFVLSTMLNGGVVLAHTQMGQAPQSHVLAEGKCVSMYDWMAGHNAAYAAWIKENLTYELENFVMDEEGEWDIVYSNVTLTGRAYATPDMSTVVLGVENVWDWEDDGVSVVFDMNVGSGVGAMAPADGSITVYDLNGRKLKNADAPGIYVINGKKVVR